MFGRVLALLPFVALVVSAGQCDTGSIRCCNSYGPANSDLIKNDPTYQASGLVSALVNADSLVGLKCGGVLGTGSSCSQNALCCEDNSFVDLVGVNCSPITIVG